MHVMKVFSGAKPEFDPILMLQMYSFRMDFPAYAQVILAGAKCRSSCGTDGDEGIPRCAGGCEGADR